MALIKWGSIHAKIESNQLNQMCSYKIKILAFKFLKEQITNLERLSSDEYTNNKTCPFINANK